MTVWVDVVARTHGLSTRMLSPAATAELARARDLRNLGSALAARRGRAAPEGVPAPQELDAVEARHASAQLRILARWIGDRQALRFLFEEEDCRSLRALLRDAIAGVPTAARVDGLIPTPSLPPRTLSQLAQCGSPASMAALLDAHAHPYGPPLLVEATRQQPDLFRMEHALIATWASRATQSTKRGGRAVRTYVRRSIDLANCWTILLVTEHGFDGPRPDLFIEGGRLVKRATFMQVVAEPNRAAAVRRLNELVRQTPLAAVTTTGPGVEERMRAALAREQKEMARWDPLGPAAVIEFWLRLRGERAAVQRLIWATSAGAPTDWRTHDTRVR